MSELTGKCKEDFEKYISNLSVAPYVVMLDQIPETYLNALITDFFDSKSIYIDIEVMTDDSSGYIRGFESQIVFIWKGDLMRNNSDLFKDDVYETRLEANQKAILKADQVYNQINK